MWVEIIKDNFWLSASARSSKIRRAAFSLSHVFHLDMKLHLFPFSIIIYFEMALTVNRYGMIAGARFATLAQVAGGASASLFPPAFPPSMDEHANSATKRI